MRFLLIDRIVELVTRERAVGIKNVCMSEDFFTHHFPERPVLPGALILEAFTQLADIVVRDATQFRDMGVLDHVSRLKFRRLVTPGDQLVLDLSVTEHCEAQMGFRGQARVGTAVAASVVFSLRLQPLEGWENREQSESHFRLLRGTP